jgi:uncharacterized caspase-like protein
MLFRFKAAAAAGLLTILASDPILAENRVALVIGNASYRSVTPLPNAENDAKRMSELLGSAGFDVTAAPDQTQNDLRRTIGDFAAKLKQKGPDTIALVFYAGHGIQVDGENFIVPVDIDPKLEADIPLQAVRLNDLLNTLSSVPNMMRIVMLDACRNNPFPAISGSTGRGLAIVDTKAGAPGTFISYSKSPGAEAEDGSGANSPYTTALLNVAREPGLQIEEAFKRVRVSVHDATQGRQVPWESSSLTSEFRFFSGTPSAAATQPIRPPVAQRTEAYWRRDLQGKPASAAFDIAISENSIEIFEAFVGLYAQDALAPRVRSLLERRKEMVAWNTAVTINTGPAYRSFLLSYPVSDLAASARKLEERFRNRSIGGAGTPVNLATAPAMCPCPTAPAQPQKTAPRVQRAQAPPRVQRVQAPVRRPPTDADVRPQGPPPPSIVIVPTFNVPIGGGGGGGRGGGGHHHPE